MGNTGSAPSARFPTVIEDPYPATESLNGISIAGSEGCNACSLQVNQNISTSSVKLRREYGTTTVDECSRLANDIRRVKNREMAFSEFKTNLQNAKYLRAGTTNEAGRRFCERVSFNDQDAANIKNIGDYEANQDKLQVLRIQEVSARAYSSDTKLHITPSIPLVLTNSGTQTPINRITLYHPCPLRVENKQYDAVISLNDPIDNPAVVYLIPVEGVSVGSGKSGQFFSRLVSYIPGILLPNANGEYEAIDVPTGADWSLTNIFETRIKNNLNEVVNGFFAWVGMPAYEQFISQDTPDVRRYSWRPSGRPSPIYVLMDTPIKVSSMDLMTLRRLPVTPPGEAIHPVPQKIYYRPYQCPTKERPTTREKFTTDECDPFNNFPESGASAVNANTIINILIGVVSFIALAVGIYYGLKYATEPTGDFFKRIGGRIGQAISRAQSSVMQSVATRAAAIEVKKREAEAKQAEERLKPKEAEKKGDEFMIKNPMLERRKTQRKVEPKEKPKDTTGVIKEDELRPGEEFAFKNPIADRRKTARVRTEVKKAEQTAEELKRVQREAAGTGLLSPEELEKVEKQRKELVSTLTKPALKKRVITSSDRNLTQEEALRTLKSKLRETDATLRKVERRKTAFARPPPLPPTKRQAEAIKENEELDKKMKEKLEKLKDMNRSPSGKPTQGEIDAAKRREKITPPLPPTDARKKPLSAIKAEGARIRSGDTEFMNRLRRKTQ